MRLRTLGPRLETVASRIQSGDNWREGKSGSTARLYNYRWQQESKAFLKEHPLCQCEECDDGRKRVTLATVVDHRIPHRGNPDLFWDRANWVAMDKSHHDAKTARGE